MSLIKIALDFRLSDSEMKLNKITNKLDHNFINRVVNPSTFDNRRKLEDANLKIFNGEGDDGIPRLFSGPEYEKDVALEQLKRNREYRKTMANLTKKSFKKNLKIGAGLIGGIGALSLGRYLYNKKNKK